MFCLRKCESVDVFTSVGVQNVTRAQVVSTLGTAIPDPWHGPLPEYQATAALLSTRIPRVLNADWDSGKLDFVRRPAEGEGKGETTGQEQEEAR